MSSKEVIYIDNEDDITSIIEKTTSSGGNIVALVLPKRFAALKSSVNLKLLKKTASKNSQKIVLITSDETLLPLAGSVGLHVAVSLKSRPEIPKFDIPKVESTILEESAVDIDETAASEELASGAGKDGKKKKSHSGGTAASEKSDKIKRIKSASKIKVPNFDKFKLRIFLAVFAVALLVVGWHFAFNIAPKANVVIQAQTSRVATEVTFTIDPTAKTDDIEQKVVVGEVQEVSKTVTERFDATGEKDTGAKATGVMTIQNCDSSDSFDLAAGTTFTDNTNGFDFVSSAAATVPGGSFSGGGCDSPGEVDVNVVAVKNGDTRNLSPRGYSVSGVSGFITGFGGSMSGGTTKLVTVVTANDIKQAEALLSEKSDDTVRAELAALFNIETVIIDGTFKVTQAPAVSSAKVDAETSEASVSSQFTYSIIGVANDSMSKILEQQQATLVDTETQSILDNGLAAVDVTIVEAIAGGNSLSAKAVTTGFVGPEINIEELAKEISGKEFSEAVSFIKDKPGVGDVLLELNPFWVFNVPGPDKTTITIEVPSDNQ